MDAAGIDYAVLYPTVAGVGGQNFGRIEDGELELACVQAYNDWLLEEWGGVESTLRSAVHHAAGVRSSRRSKKFAAVSPTATAA